MVLKLLPVRPKQKWFDWCNIKKIKDLPMRILAADPICRCTLNLSIQCFFYKLTLKLFIFKRALKG